MVELSHGIAGLPRYLEGVLRPPSGGPTKEGNCKHSRNTGGIIYERFGCVKCANRPGEGRASSQNIGDCSRSLRELGGLRGDCLC